MTGRVKPKPRRGLGTRRQGASIAEPRTSRAPVASGSSSRSCRPCALPFARTPVHLLLGNHHRLPLAFCPPAPEPRLRSSPAPAWPTGHAPSHVPRTPRACSRPRTRDGPPRSGDALHQALPDVRPGTRSHECTSTGLWMRRRQVGMEASAVVVWCKLPHARRRTVGHNARRETTPSRMALYLC